MDQGITLGLNELTITNGSQNYQGGAIFNNGTVNVNNSTFSGNSASNRGYGGGIYNYSGNLTVSNSTFSENSASNRGGIYNYGGGIYNYHGTVIVNNSTFCGNSTSNGYGGGISITGGMINVYNSTFNGNSTTYGFGGGISITDGTLNVSNSTLSGNSAAYGYGGGILNQNGQVTLGNTIIANSPWGGNCVGTIIDNGGNISFPDTTCPGINSNPFLGPLRDNGGPTQTLALLPGSPAIDAANPDTCPATDQRGISRPVDGNDDGMALCDIGAYEKVNFPPTISDIPDQYIYANRPTITIPFTVDDIDSPASSLTLTVDSSNLTLIPLENITFGGLGANRTIAITPVNDLPGTATITVTVSDGDLTVSDSFLLTVKPNIYIPLILREY